jgi:hypothetical protein
MGVFNFKRRKVGGIWFVKLGRINLSFSVSRPVPSGFVMDAAFEERLMAAMLPR